MDEELLRIIDLFDDDEVTTADKIDRPAAASYREMFDDFNARNPFAGGGMLVQPGFGGTRQGYAKDKKVYGQDAAPLTKEQKKNIKLYNKNVEKYGGVKFEDIPNTGKSNSNKKYGIKTGRITGTGYDFDRSKIDYKESAAYKKSITPKGYISSTELFELIDNPKLKSGNFQQARKFERNPKKYPGKKNYVYNYIKKLLNEKQVGKAGSESLAAQKFFYKKPTKAELDKINSFIDSRILETGTVDNIKIFHKEFGKLFEGKKTKGFFNDTISLDKARAALKKYGINATDSQLARAMMRLGQIYDGHTFQNEINIPKNKSAGKFIEKSFNELDIYNGWRSASYDAAMDDINKVVGKSAGDIRSFKYTLNNYIKENYPQIFKNYDVNEIFSLTTSSVRGSYPYAYFIDLTKNDINQKALSSFQGKASIAEGKIQKAITNFRRTGNQKFYNEAVRVADVFNNTTRKNFLSDERIIKTGGVNALKLEIGSQQQIKDKIGFASEYYKKNNLKKWKDQGIDIDAHTAKSGYVKTFDGKTPPRGVATFGDIIQGGKVNEKQFKNLLASNNLLARIGCPGKGSGGRVGFFTGQNLEACAIKGAQKLRSTDPKNLSPADRRNFQNLTKTAQGIRLAKNILGPAALAYEAAFALPFALYDYQAGRPGIDIAKNVATFGLMDQKLRDAELKKIDPTYGQAQKLDEVSARFDELERLSQFGTRGQRIRNKAKFENIVPELQQAYEPFMVDGVIDPNLYLQNIADSKEAEKELQRLYDIRGQERKSEFDLGDPFMAAGGGIAGLSGGIDEGPQTVSMNPDSQGLRSLKNRVRNL